MLPDNNDDIDAITQTDSINMFQTNHNHQQACSNPYTSAQLHETKLLKILDDIQAPHFVYKQILHWAQKAYSDNYNFMPERKSRKAQINYLKNWTNFPEACTPKLVQVELSTTPGQPAQTIDITVFNFTGQLVSLLNDQSLFGDIATLDVNPKDVFGKYKVPGGKLSSINSGKRYKDAYQQMIQDTNKDFLLPIIFACDETKLSGGKKAGCWPLTFTTTLLNQKARNNPKAWRSLGYIMIYH